MKNGFKRSVLVAAVLLSGLWCRAQQPGLTPPPPPPRANNLPGNPPPPPGRPSALAQLSTLNGKIIAYTANDRYEYDSFTLQSSDKTVTVNFPAHLAAQLMKAAPKGSEVNVMGAFDDTPEGIAFRFYSLKDGNNLVTDAPPAVDQEPLSEQLKNFSGTISDLNHDRRGMINGVVLDGKTLVSLPPPAVEQLSPYLKTGTQLSGTGISRGIPSGVVIARNIEVTDARTLSIAGQTYLIR